MSKMNSMKELMRRASITRALACVLAFASFASGQQDAIAGPREQAKRMYDRLTGTPPAPDVLTDLTSRVGGGSQAELVSTAMYIMTPRTERSKSFYSVTLKNFAAPWTNRDQSIFAPLNDYTATVIGMVRDDADFRTVLYDDVAYIGQGISPAYSPTGNEHYVTLESNNHDLGAVLTRVPQSSLNGLPSDATAGIITSRAASEAFFIDGTNRAMFRFTLLNHLCRDLEQVHDTTRPPDRIRQDISRSPGGDSSIYNNNCIGCHSGMDPLAQAFAYYDFDETVGRLVYTSGQVQPKYLINADNFKQGYVTTDDQWENRWRLPGQNTLLGWENADGQIRSGNGAKSLGRELAHSNAFAQCQVDKVFRAICFRSPSDDPDRAERDRIVSEFRSSGYNMKTVFAETAAYCAGE